MAALEYKIQGQKDRKQLILHFMRRNFINTVSGIFYTMKRFLSPEVTREGEDYLFWVQRERVAAQMKFML